jgi:hypothetical protein
MAWVVYTTDEQRIGAEEGTKAWVTTRKRVSTVQEKEKRQGGGDSKVWATKEKK